MKAIGMGDARSHFADMVKETSSYGEKFIIHSRGTAKAVLMSIDEYRDIEATLEEMSDPEAKKLLKKGNAEIGRGRTKTVEDIFGEALL